MVRESRQAAQKAYASTKGRGSWFLCANGYHPFCQLEDKTEVLCVYNGRSQNSLDAEYSSRISPTETIAFVQRARKAAPFSLSLIQTDNGQEFSKACEQSLATMGIAQRRIRLGKKNDNAHIERFNRTIQDECLGRWPAIAGIQARLTAYLDFYNTKRLHLGLKCMTPVEVLQRY